MIPSGPYRANGGPSAQVTTDSVSSRQRRLNAAWPVTKPYPGSIRNRGNCCWGFLQPTAKHAKFPQDHYLGHLLLTSNVWIAARSLSITTPTVNNLRRKLQLRFVFRHAASIRALLVTLLQEKRILGLDDLIASITQQPATSGTQSRSGTIPALTKMFRKFRDF